MTGQFTGTYFDGTSGQRHVVELRRIGASHFALDGDGIERSGAIDTLSITPRLARVARTVEFPDGARLLLAHDAEIDAWFPHSGRLEGFVDRLEHHAYAIAAAIFVCFATLAIGAIWGVPKAADSIAFRIPPSAEHALGDEVLAQLDGLGLETSKLGSQERSDLTDRFSKLAGDASVEYRLEFRDAPGIGANAFAIPGGTVVVTDQLVKALVDHREFDAVVAHEMGHEQRRHALRQALRGSMVAIVAAFFTGDVSSAGTVVVAVPTFLLTSHYSREFEEEADRYAFDLLSQREESPHWFAAAMRHIEAQHPNRRRAYASYLSSHPDTEARIEAADEAAHAFAAAHPDLCPSGICPGEKADDGSGGNTDAPPQDLACEKAAQLDAIACRHTGGA